MVVLVILLAVSAYGLFRTSQLPALTVANSTDRNANGETGFVDQTPLTTAQGLAALASGDDEHPLAREALRVGDHEVDLAFAAALRNAAQHPPVLSAAAMELQARLSEAQSAVENDNAQIQRLTASEGNATGDRKSSLADQLEVAKSQLELDQDEVEDAKQYLIRAGGDPQGRIQAMVQEHEAAAHDMPAPTAANGDAGQAGGLVHRLQQWFALRQKQIRLARAKQDALGAAAGLTAQHDALVVKIGGKKGSVAVNTEKSDAAEAPDQHGAGPHISVANPAPSSHEQAALMVKVTKERSAQQNELATLDKRIESYNDLASVYERWIGVVSGKRQSTLRLVIWCLTIILFILLMAMFVSTWLERLLGKLPLARRQVDTLRAVTRLALQILAVLLTLVVIFGPPGELGTFLGLAGAGLTVALRDFIVSFAGWFVLMGRNGIRLGDWVEINGVTGEVVELGMFHTLLLETGNWTDSGHPTGRRVTFTNSFAIEGHYFNFSTSGQWLWDELQIMLPAGNDPFPIVDAIQKKVVEVTSESAGLAEQEWQHAARSRDMSVLSAAPAVNVRPVIGGIELAVRYITRASERYQLRAKLYHIAMDLMAQKDLTTPGPPTANSAITADSTEKAATVPPAEIAETKS